PSSLRRRSSGYLRPTTRLTGKPRRRRAPGRGDWPMTRPWSDRLERALRTVPTEQCLARIRCFAIPSRRPSTRGTRHRTGGGGGGGGGGRGGGGGGGGGACEGGARARQRV